MRTLLVCLLFFLANTASAAVEVNVHASRAPNGFGSPSFAAYQSNAIYALQNGLSSWGTPGLPTYYEQLANGATIDAHLNIVTGFPSWDGVAEPGGVFASEYGNRLHFSLHIVGNGEKFSISQLSFVGDATNDILDFAFAGGYAYGSGYVGLDYGVDGVKGTGDDVFVTGGASTQLIDELFGRGSGNAIAAYDSDVGNTRQEKIDNVINSVSTPYDFTGTYILALDEGDITGSAGVHVTNAGAIPEPASVVVWMFLVGIVGLVVRKRRPA